MICSERSTAAGWCLHRSEIGLVHDHDHRQVALLAWHPPDAADQLAVVIQLDLGTTRWAGIDVGPGRLPALPSRVARCAGYWLRPRRSPRRPLPGQVALWDSP